MKLFNTKKENSTIYLLGYSAEDLKNDMINKFLTGMTWENHGDWHIDHKKPVTKFAPDTPVSKVCALDNLEPLWKFDNLSKGNKY